MCVPLCVCAPVYIRCFVPAAGVGLWHERLLCLGASNWGDQQLGAATGQSECQCPTVYVDPHHTHVYKYICILIHILAGGCPS